MQPNQQLIEYFRTHLEQGFTELQISDSLRQAGWDEASIEQAASAFRPILQPHLQMQNAARFGRNLLHICQRPLAAFVDCSNWPHWPAHRYRRFQLGSSCCDSFDGCGDLRNYPYLILLGIGAICGDVRTADSYIKDPTAK